MRSVYALYGTVASSSLSALKSEANVGTGSISCKVDLHRLPGQECTKTPRVL